MDENVFHSCWTCPKAKKYWKMIQTWLEELTKNKIDFVPELFLLGIIKKNYNRKMKYLILHILTAARISYAQYWKKNSIPPDGLIIKKNLECVEMDKLTMELKGKTDTEYNAVWETWFIWIDNRYKIQNINNVYNK
uniref:Uncharacterized protein n=1 Tax=Micrurus spixii TaxID=129469 RepID=A0A2D4M1X3_9SAUR